MQIFRSPRLFLLSLLVPSLLCAQKRSAGVVIPVDDVKPATTAYNQYETASVLGQSLSKNVLVSSETTRLIVPDATGNSFIGTIHLAYAQHHDLVLSPDDIWIQIALGVSIHLNEHWDELNRLVVKSPEREQLNVRIDALANMQTSAWQQLIDTFAVMAKEKTQPDFYKTMLPDFSTSTQETRTVLHAVLLSSIRESLEMRAASGCGIPNIVLTGTKADWEKLLVHVGELEKYGLKFWTDELKPILREFVNAFDGKADRRFWQRIYKYREGYMVSQMNGWASKFFPYFTESEYVGDPEAIAQYLSETPGSEAAESVVKTVYYVNPYLKGDDYLLQPVSLWNLPTSVCTVPFTWSNLFSDRPEDHEQQLLLHAGFSGSIQDEKTLALRNNPEWYIVRRQEYIEPDWDDWLSSGVRNADLLDGLWSERPVDGEAVNAIYHPEKNLTISEGLEELKAELRKHLKKNYPTDDLAGTKIQFTVSHFGSVTKIVFIKYPKLSEGARIALDLKLKKLEYTFRPTHVPVKALWQEIHLDDSPANVPDEVPANSVVTLAF